MKQMLSRMALLTERRDVVNIDTKINHSEGDLSSVWLYDQGL